MMTMMMMMMMMTTTTTTTTTMMVTLLSTIFSEQLYPPGNAPVPAPTTRLRGCLLILVSCQARVVRCSAVQRIVVCVHACVLTSELAVTRVFKAFTFGKRRDLELEACHLCACVCVHTYKCGCVCMHVFMFSYSRTSLFIAA